ncbi:MAG: hypothetical protein AB7G28_21940 [Pirellulales bacterium]
MRAFLHPLRLTLLAALAVALTGCPTIRMPQLANPGPAGYQRYNALQFDPYPLDDVAPAVAGARPQEYARPIPEVKRGQAFTPKRLRPAPVLTSPFPTPASPVLNAPPALPTSSSMPVTSIPATAPPATGLPYQAAPTPPPVTIVPTTPSVRAPY